MGRLFLRRRIWGYSVCLCPKKRMPGLYGLIMFSYFAGTYYCYDRYYYLKNAGSPDETLGIAPAFAGEFSYYLGLKQTWLAFGKITSMSSC